MRILLVDDNEDFLRIMEELLQGQGYTTLVAHDGKQARELLEDEHVDVIISDVFMPTLDGVRFHSYVREFLGRTDLPFIFISGYDDPYTTTALQDESVDFFLSKTCSPRDITTLLERLKSTTQV